MQTLKQLRIEKGFQPEDIASYISKSRKTVDSYENGHAHTMNFATAIRYSQLLEVTLEEFCGIIFPSNAEYEPYTVI